MTRNTRVNLSRQSRFHNTNNFIPTGMLMMDERLHSNLTPDHWGMTTSLHKRRKLGVWNCRKGPFILKKPWCCHWNGICILMTLWRQMMYMVPLPFCFLKTPPFTSHFCTHLRVSSLASFIAAVRNNGSFFQKGLKQSVRDARSQRNLLTTCTCFKDCVTNLKVLSTKNSLNHK